MKDRFYIVLNDAYVDSWSEVMWSECSNAAKIFLDSSNLKNSILRKLKKLNFSNKANHYIWLPGKQIWDFFTSIRYDDLDERCRNFIIFQSNVKISPHYLKKLKAEKNARIIMYLPDTISKLGIANTVKELKRYCDYYMIDLIYSFDKKDCDKYNLQFFDMYSVLSVKKKSITHNKPVLFYVGNCRSKSRLKFLHEIYLTSKNECECQFYITGVNIEDQLKDSDIIYNKPMTYREVVKHIVAADCLLEYVNENQSGNTLRAKEAICYNKKLLTNNANIYQNKYFKNGGAYIIDDPNSFDYKCLVEKSHFFYNYNGDYSPLKFLDIIRDEKI